MALVAAVVLSCTTDPPLQTAAADDPQATGPMMPAMGADAGVPAEPDDDPTRLPSDDGALGTRCETSADCTAVYPVCASVDSGVWAPGGPSFGYCTRACDASAARDDCATLDPGSTCRSVRPGAEGHCVLGCRRGTPTDPTAKCQGRSELACMTLDANSGSGACLPSCGISLDCVAGTECNIATGFCEPAPLTPLLGSACDPDPGTDTVCPGWCYALTATTGFCAGRCTIGAQIACGFEAPPRASICAFAEDTSIGPSGVPLAGAGDLGLCLPSCSCTSDCPQGAVCLALSEFEAFVTGRAGLCLSPELAGGERPELTTCP